MRWPDRCEAVLVVLSLSACGGSGSSGGSGDVVTPPASPAPGSAAECFNPQLFAVGAGYSLDYQITGAFGGSRSRVARVEASSTGPGDRLVVTNTSTNYSPPVPGGTDVKVTSELQTLAGMEIITKQVIETHTVVGQNFTTVYQPALRDSRYLLSSGGEFSLVRNFSVDGGPALTSATTIRYLGQESVTVPAGTYTACKFEEQLAATDFLTTWIAKDKGILVKSVKRAKPGEMEELMGTPRLNGQPI